MLSMSICFIIIFYTLCRTMWLPRKWLSFFRSRCPSQANLIGFRVSYKVESFTILKAPYPTGQPARSREAGYISWDKCFPVRCHRRVLPSTPSRSIEHFVILEHFETSISKPTRLRDHCAYWDRLPLETVEHLVTVKHVKTVEQTVEIVEYVKNVV